LAVHQYRPERYYSAIGSHPVALRIASGDSVATTTVDARGHDSSDQPASQPGNPQTGPFFIDGAEPGDVLAVRLDSIRPNRRRGWSRGVVASNVVDPGFVASLPGDEELTEWHVDADAGTATLVKPDAALGRLTLPLTPMLGCFGVAPPGGQAISCATSSTHGGNMDYRGFGPGVTVFFPVFVPGALLHVGDGHATQGDGEIVGTGIEISMDVRFTASVVRKGRPIFWPRADDGTYLIAAGNARPLDQATQHATTELLRWLGEDYGLDLRSASLLLGQCVRYEIGNVFDPAYTVICKIEKRLLPAPKEGVALTA